MFVYKSVSMCVFATPESVPFRCRPNCSEIGGEREGLYYDTVGMTRGRCGTQLLNDFYERVVVPVRLCELTLK